MSGLSAELWEHSSIAVRAQRRALKCMVSGWGVEVPVKGFVTGLSAQKDKYVAFGKMIFSSRDQSFEMEFWKLMINREQEPNCPRPVGFCSVTDTVFMHNALFFF